MQCRLLLAASERSYVAIKVIGNLVLFELHFFATLLDSIGIVTKTANHKDICLELVICSTGSRLKSRWSYCPLVRSRMVSEIGIIEL